MKTPLISVVVTVWNADLKDLGQCFDSIANQTYSNLEVILVDDGSKRPVADYCDKYVKKPDNSKWRVIHQRNQGPSSARNNGLRKATGEYIIFLDQDDIFESNLVEELANVAIKHHVDVAICGFKVFDDRTGQISSWEDRNLYANRVLSLDSLSKDKFPLLLFGNQVWTKLIKRDLLIKNHLVFDQNIMWGEDMLFVTELLVLANKIYIIADELITYRIKSGDSITDNAAIHKHEMLYVLRRIRDILTEHNVCDKWGDAYWRFATATVDLDHDYKNDEINFIVQIAKHMRTCQYNDFGIKQAINMLITALKRSIKIRLAGHGLRRK